MHEAIQNVVQTLRSKLIDPSTPIAAKWRALFALRNIAGSSAEDAMIDGMKANILQKLCPLSLKQMSSLAISPLPLWTALLPMAQR